MFQPVGARVGLVALVALALLPQGCGKIEEAIEEETEERIRERAGGEIPGETPAPAPNEDAIVVNRTEPNVGAIGGGDTINILGEGFSENDEVSFGGSVVPPENTFFFDSNRIEVSTPPVSGPGVVDVAVRNPQSGESATLSGGFEYLQAPEIESVSPRRGPSAGGAQITVKGTGFSPGTELFFGTTQSFATVVDSETLIASTPPLAVGLYTIRVTNLGGSDELQDIYQPYERLRLSEVRPLIADLAGGNQVLVVGQGFIPGTSFAIDGSVYDNEGVGDTVLVDFTEREASFVLAPGASEGPVDVEVANTQGSARLRDGLVYIDFSDTTPRIVAISPNVALAEGGSPVTIVGVGFDDPNVTVTFDGVPASCFAESAFVIRCTAPPGDGDTDVRVISGPVDVTASDGIRFIPLRIDTLVDNRGARAGGTYLRLFGDGFDETTEVFFDGLPARDVTLVSEDELTLRTPSGFAGFADVEVQTQGVSRVAEGAFEYFDPALDPLWTSGGPIDGAVNITVYDNVTGFPLPGAYVMLGTNAAPTYSGFTDSNGQITFSGPDVLGPVTVTAARSDFLTETGIRVDFTTFSYVDVNSQNLKFEMFRPGPPPNPIPGGGGGPPVVSGNVIRLKDQYNDANDLVRMTTTAALLGFPLPDPGPGAELVNSGSYEMITRTGDLVVLALVGSVNELTGAFDVKTMGFSPPFAAQADGVYEYDIVVDTPLDASLSITFDGPPTAGSPGVDPNFGGTTPNAARAVVYYDFGSAGVHLMHDVRVLDTDQLFAPMPRALPTPHTGTPFVISNAGFYNGFSSSLDGSISLAYPLSLARIGERTDATQPVIVGPMLGVPHNLLPAPAGDDDSILLSDDQPISFQVTSNKPDTSTVNVYRLEGSDGFARSLEWFVMTPGGIASFDLPPPSIPTLSMPNTFYTVRMQRYREDSTQYNGLDFFGLLAAEYYSEAQFSLEIGSPSSP